MQLLYITCSNKEEAWSLAHILLNEKFIACANIIDSITSVYEWEGEIREGSEAVLLVKTADETVENAIDAIKTYHSYDCPCVLSIDIKAGNSDFLEWVERVTLIQKDEA